MNKSNATKERPFTGPDDHRHGTDNCYTYWKCRCDRCKAAHATAARMKRDVSLMARCPVCGDRPVGAPVVQVQDGISHAYYLDPAGHAWETRWMVAD